MGQLTMSNREIDKLKVIQNMLDGKLTRPQAAETLSISERQAGRICARVCKEGNRGGIHGLKGRESIPACRRRESIIRKSPPGGR
ncbi:MAG: hypothetical protein KKH28_07575 [Elusimicrobia bacterium]|nr:hypothetical protein [Elusimicrobiota bacterium]